MRDREDPTHTAEPQADDVKRERQQHRRARAEARGDREERRWTVMELRHAGATYRDIARHLQISIATAHKDYTHAVRTWAQPIADELRDTEAARYDRLQLAYWQKALDGDHAAAQIVLRIFDRRARLFGLDEPAKIDITAFLEKAAEEAGIDVEEIIADAEEIIRRSGI